MKVQLTVEQVKELLVIAQQRGTVDSWIRLAVEWMEEASRQATDMKEQLNKQKTTLENSSAERLQEKVVCASCGNAGYIYSSAGPLNGYPCPTCNSWYKGSR